MSDDAGLVRLILASRRKRDVLFPDLFADPAWDMLLDLYGAALEDRQISVSSLCLAAAVPQSTSLRWISTLLDQGLIIREADPFDRRRCYVTLTNDAFEKMDQLFQWITDRAGSCELPSIGSDRQPRSYYLAEFSADDLVFEIGRRVRGGRPIARPI